MGRDRSVVECLNEDGKRHHPIEFRDQCLHDDSGVDKSIGTLGVECLREDEKKHPHSDLRDSCLRDGSGVESECHDQCWRDAREALRTTFAATVVDNFFEHFFAVEGYRRCADVAKKLNRDISTDLVESLRETFVQMLEGLEPDGKMPDGTKVFDEQTAVEACSLFEKRAPGEVQRVLTSG